MNCVIVKRVYNLRFFRPSATRSVIPKSIRVATVKVLRPPTNHLTRVEIVIKTKTGKSTKAPATKIARKLINTKVPAPHRKISIIPAVAAQSTKAKTKTEIVSVKRIKIDIRSAARVDRSTRAKTKSAQIVTRTRAPAHLTKTNRRRHVTRTRAK